MEYASTRLMSVCARPMVAAKSAVATPIHATTVSATGDCSKITWLRATM